jgi:hypothetical protein
MEITLTLGTIVFFLLALKFAKPNFFNFGTVINNNYRERDAEQLSDSERKMIDAKQPGKLGNRS